MKIDNAAARLHDFLIRTHNSNTSRDTRWVLQQFLNMPGVPDHELYRGLAGLLELPGKVQTELENHFPDNGLSHWNDRVSRAFSQISLNAMWGGIMSPIDERTLTELNMLSLLFRTKGEVALIDQSEMSEYKAKIEELKEDTIAADLSIEMRTTILQYLNKILSAIESYQITGVEPIMEAMESIIGRAALNEEYSKALKDTGIGKKIGDIVGLVANAVTVAQGIPFVATPLLTFLGSR
ncbi:hypothetical protein RJ218_003850 [Enterobacter hormaechei]|uniref:Uncharacterized protein n=3 Tax=Enterobacteriaceae TaxID=543 RepID=A0ABY7L7D8_CITFR|nr:MULTISPECIES: hypothetical protein [Enterobacteriaceae]MCU2294305.1 hypothetical protein [Enterobacter hormaechei subsp. steigerwaltii]HED3824040.1 hypothetical protein [Enterobacter hormaechei subsp. oharae]EIJ9085003.1 hypothetical protein [Citrobacter freundii]EKS6346590.1 hypothetical protein [Enterobacter hormaechei]EKX7629424.1 hypothetical protein [Enterobacter mori]